MKRIKLFLIVFLLLVVTGCGKTATIKKINLDEYNKLIDNKETFILEVMRQSCSHCEILKPRLEEVAKEYNINIKSIDLDSIKNVIELEEFTEKTSDGTPTIIFYEKGEEKSVAYRIVGSVTKQKLVEKFKDMGYIK